MKKISKILIPLLCLIMLCGCEIYVYDVGGSNPADTDGSENLTQGGTGSTIVTDNIEYNGFIKYTSQAPTEDTQWDVIYNKVKSSVVTIRNVVNNQVVSTGSGVFFAQDSASNGNAYIYTNAHVVKGSTSIEVLLSNGILVQGTLIGYDDITLIPQFSALKGRKDCDTSVIINGDKYDLPLAIAPMITITTPEMIYCCYKNNKFF